MSENNFTLINVVPNFVDKALEKPAVEIGNVLGNIFYSVFSPINFPMEKYRIKKTIELEQYEEEIRAEVRKIPQENLIEPPLNIVGPALEASKYFIESEDLRNMFANLIASSVDNRKNSSIHPSFVEIIKQLTSDEAKIIRAITDNHPKPIISIRKKRPNVKGDQLGLENFTTLPYILGCEFPTSFASQLDNLNRLGLISINKDMHLTDDSYYSPLENHPFILKLIDELKKADYEPIFKKSVFSRTDFGANFYKCCVQ